MGKRKKDSKEIHNIKAKRICSKFDPISSLNTLLKLKLE